MKLKQTTILYLFLNTSEGNTSSSVLVNKLSESCLVLDEAEGNILLSAELWEPDNSFDGINVMGNHNQFSLLFFDESGDIVKSKFNFMSWGLECWLLLF